MYFGVIKLYYNFDAINHPLITIDLIKSRNKGMWRAVRTMVSASLDAFFPRTCRVCGCSLAVGEDLLCASCMADLPRTRLHREVFNTVHQRVGGKNSIDVAAGWFYYYRDSPYARLVHEAKYGDRPLTARKLGRLYGLELAADGLAGCFDVLLPVPLHRDKLLKRGYNQSLEVARGLAGQLGCDVGDNIVAVRSHSTQTRRGGYDRYANVKGSFAVEHGAELDGLRVAIVDDIITTGSTIHECVDAVTSSSSPASVSVLSIGVTKMR